MGHERTVPKDTNAPMLTKGYTCQTSPCTEEKRKRGEGGVFEGTAMANVPVLVLIVHS